MFIPITETNAVEKNPVVCCPVVCKTHCQFDPQKTQHVVIYRLCSCLLRQALNIFQSVTIQRSIISFSALLSAFEGASTWRKGQETFVRMIPSCSFKKDVWEFSFCMLLHAFATIIKKRQRQKIRKKICSLARNDTCYIETP